MAAEVKEWVEGGGAVASKKVLLKEKAGAMTSSSEAPTSNSSSAATTEPAAPGEPALSVISDTQSEEYSSDSGKGGSDSTVTPPDSLPGSVDPLTGSAVEPQWTYYPGYTLYTPYSKSMGSAMPNHPMIYEFEIPQLIVGRLIGRYGTYVNKIKTSSGASIIVKRHPKDKYTKICAVEGSYTEINLAIEIIRERFPLKRYPHLTLEQTNMQPMTPISHVSFIPNNRLSLLDGVVNDVNVSCILDLDHIFVQQPTHPTFPALTRLHDTLKMVYEIPNCAPELVRPFNPGVICVTKIGSEDWVRVEVVVVHNEKEKVTARLVDVGGYVQVPFEALRQIRVDFVTIPFQATECRLANIAPLNEKDGWTEEATTFFKILVQKQVLQAHVVGYCNTTGATLINLYKPNGNKNYLCINEEMVAHNYARWIDELDQQYYYAECVTDYTSGFGQFTANGEWLAVPTEQYEYAVTEETAIAMFEPLEEINETQEEQDQSTTIEPTIEGLVETTSNLKVSEEVVENVDCTEETAPAKNDKESITKATEKDSTDVTNVTTKPKMTFSRSWADEMEEMHAHLTEEQTTTNVAAKVNSDDCNKDANDNLYAKQVGACNFKESKSKKDKVEPDRTDKEGTVKGKQKKRVK